MSIDYYYPIRLIDTTDPVFQPSIRCWQHIQEDDDGTNGRQVRFCYDNGLTVTPPDRYEAPHLTEPPVRHFQPGVEKDPSAYQPVPWPKFVAMNEALQKARASGDPAVADKGEQVFAFWLADEQAKELAYNEAKKKG